MNKMKKMLGTMSLLLVIFLATAQNGTVKGIIKTSDANPAELVTIIVKGTGKGTQTDKEGTFEITNIKPGTYTLEASLTGLKTQSKKIDVKADQTVSLDFTLEETKSNPTNNTIRRYNS